MAIEIKSNNFEKEVTQSDKIVFADFWAEWCGPCQMMGPVFEGLSKEITKAKFVKINVDQNSNLANQYTISGIPCILALKQGKEIGRVVGFKPAEELKKELLKFI